MNASINYYAKAPKIGRGVWTGFAAAALPYVVAAWEFVALRG